jgi:hydrogenase nickel incorporation protein HypA/HybF
MHELSLCQAIAERVSSRADPGSLRRVVVRVGHLRQVVPDALAFSWQVLTDGTELDGCELEIEHVPATVHCAACDLTTTLDTPVLACRHCGSVSVELRTGEELLIVSLERAEV